MSNFSVTKGVHTMAPEDHVTTGTTSTFKKGPSNHRTDSFISVTKADLIIKVGFYKSLGEPTRHTRRPSALEVFPQAAGSLQQEFQDRQNIAIYLNLPNTSAQNSLNERFRKPNQQPPKP